MADHKEKGGGPPRTRAINFGQELPPSDVASLYGKSDPLPKDMVVKLHVEAGPSAPSVVSVTKSVMVLGRGADFADVEVDDESASRRHAYIVYRDGKLILSDMGSTNGTILNGKIVGAAPLKDGDRIQIGTVVLRLEISK
jgi:pSer/pThr/pTyr-binding forkhead associated (FHA) protein